MKTLMYSKLSKGITLIALYVTTFVMILSMIGMQIIPNEVSYFDSIDFREQFVKKAGYVRDWIVRYDETTIFSEVTQEQIDIYIKNHDGLITSEEAKNGILADRNSYYSRIKNELVSTNKNLDYLAIDIGTGRQITNVDGDNTDEIIKELTTRSNYLMGNGYHILNLKYGTKERISYYSDQYTMDRNYYAGEKFDGQENYRIYVALKENLVPGDDFYIGNKKSQVDQEYGEMFYNLCVVTVFIEIILLVCLSLTTGRNSKNDEIKLDRFDKLPFEIQFTVVGLAYLLYFILNELFIMRFGYYDISLIRIGLNGVQYKVLGIMIYFILSMPAIMMTVKLYSSWIKHIKDKSIIENFGIYKLGHDLYEVADTKAKTIGIIGFIIFINAVGSCMLAFIAENYFNRVGLWGILPIIIWNTIILAILIKFFVDYKKILNVAKGITEGELDRKVELDRSLPILEEMAGVVNSMGTGLEKAVGNSLKSERLKTELITNVSHDLKTPLTSIISYIDLLKGENIENVAAREYISILDERSHRLKQLVEDLVEASKAVTGNLRAEVQELCLDELVGQAIGEYQDRIEANGLILVCDKMEQVQVLADGRHMWRIVENLLANVCKYAMPHTRVYIEVRSKEDYGYCTIKNISKEPLDIDPKELTERFVRGDEARTTEGSGLGLAIAKSLILLQQGFIDIVIDGDLFKVTVKVPLAKQNVVNLEK